MAAIDNTANKFIGQGIIFPITINSNGRPDIVGGGTLIKASITTILSFVIGTRYMLGEFGGKLERLLQEPNDSIMQSLVRIFIIEAVSRWEKRVEILSVSVEGKQDNKIDISIVYQIKGTKITDSFIFPYYSQIIY